MTKQWIGLCVLALSFLWYGCTATTEPILQEQGLDILPSWSNDGSLVAFTGIYNGTQGIYLIDTAGINRRLLVAGLVSGCSWSPDSKWLTYGASDGIYKIKADGDSATRLTTQASDYHPAWSPDGNSIAFVRVGYGVLTYSVQTGLISVVFGSASSPSWHSNGNVIVLSAVYRGSNVGTSYSFSTVRTDSLDSRLLYTFFSFDYCSYSSVSLSGAALQEIAYAQKPLNDYTQVWKLALSTGLRTQLTTDSGDGPAWSPDGSKIVYTRTLQGDGGLWIMNSDGTGKRRLTKPS